MPRAREQEIEEDRINMDVDPEVKKSDKAATSDVDDVTGDDLEEDEDDEGLAQRKPPLKKPPATDDADDLEDTRLAYDIEDDDAEPGRGEGRRARRNRARRVRQSQDSQTIQQLQSQVTELRGAIDSMSRGQIGLAASDIDGQIRQVQTHLQTIDSAFAKAVSDGDGATLQRAMALRDEARDRLAELGVAKRRLVYEAQNGGARIEPTENLQRGGPQKVQRDPVADRLADRFMDRHPWFDPDDPTDEDSQIVKSIDSVLWSEGYRPNTKMYWVELENRVRARGIGGEGLEDDGGSDMGDERDTRRTAPRLPGRPPTSGGRRGMRPAGTGFKLDAFMVQTLDDLGLRDAASLNKDQIAQRNKYISQWKAGMKAAKAAGKL